MHFSFVSLTTGTADALLRLSSFNETAMNRLVFERTEYRKKTRRNRQTGDNRLSQFLETLKRRSNVEVDR